MSNPLKYVTSTPTGALKHANLGVGVANAQYDETFNSGINPTTLTTYYLVYEPVEGVATRIYAPANSTELIQLAQSKGSTETTEAGALTWLSDNGYYPANKVLDSVVTDNLVLYFDASSATSYPRSGTDWLDLGGGGGSNNDATLENGPTFNENGWIDLDGVDDQIELGNQQEELQLIQGKSAISLCILYKMDSLGSLKGLLGTSNYSCGKNLGLVASGTTLQFYNDTAACNNAGINSAVETGRWMYAVGTYDGTNTRLYNLKGGVIAEANNTTKSGNTNEFSSTFSILGANRNDFFTEGSVARASVYQKTLSMGEILQNYYQGSITTTNLVGAFDPSNLVSYEPGTTTTFSLTGSVGAAGDGTLDNGVAYSDSGNGAWVFDGVDDQIDFGNPSSLSNAQVTVTFWYNPTTLMNNTYGGIMNGRTPGGKFCLFWINGTTLSTQYKDDSGLSRANGGVWTRSQTATGAVSSTNQWYFIQITGNESTDEWRVGVDLNVSTTDFGSQYVDPDSNQWLLGRRSSAAYDHSKIANLQIYDRILSQVEIEQNYNANVKKFT